MFLADTNIISELARREPDRGVVAWSREVIQLSVSVVTVDEIVFGLSWKPNCRVSNWLDQFFSTYCQVMPVTEAIARTSGGLRGLLSSRGISLTMADSLIAATAKVHGLVLVTRNTRDFESCAVPLLNPFQ